MTNNPYGRNESNSSGTWLIILLALLIGLFVIGKRFAWCEEVNLDIIAQIESNNNPLAYNRNSGAVGLCQITSVCLSDYNLCNKTCYEITDLLSPKFNLFIAYWYLNKRIPQMLRAKNKPITLDNILWAYNAGIGKVVKGICPKETRNYIKKYQRLARAK